MQDNNNTCSTYEDILKKNKGLLTVNCKVPVKDRTSLALVYTPGVGASCKLIEKDQNRAFDLTNKLNSMLIITDSSSLPYKSNNSLIGYPYIEAICVYYKIVANIDAYPIIIDINQIKNHKDFQETVFSLTPAFSCIEFFGVSQDRIKDFTSKSQFAFIGSDYKTRISIDELFCKQKISSNFIYSAVLRASLDLQIYQNLTECVEYLIRYLTDNRALNNINYFSLLCELVSKAAEFLIKTNKLSPATDKLIFVKNKFFKFLIDGKSAWVEEYPNNYLFQKHNINENSVLLHRRID